MQPRVAALRGYPGSKAIQFLYPERVPSMEESKMPPTLADWSTVLVRHEIAYDKRLACD